MNADLIVGEEKVLVPLMGDKSQNGRKIFATWSDFI